MPIDLRNFFVVVALIGLPGFQAHSMDLGEFEFLNSCAQCHGRDAKGGGPMEKYMTVTAPDLTTLAKNNNGVFPVKSVYEFIDGSADVGAHGREMPVWGMRYTADAFQAIDDPSADFPFHPLDPKAGHQSYVRERILSLIDYLARLQVK